MTVLFALSGCAGPSVSVNSDGFGQSEIGELFKTLHIYNISALEIKSETLKLFDDKNNDSPDGRRARAQQIGMTCGDLSITTCRYLGESGCLFSLPGTPDRNVRISILINVNINKSIYSMIVEKTFFNLPGSQSTIKDEAK